MSAAAVPDLDDFVVRGGLPCSVCNVPLDLLTQIETRRKADPRRFTYPRIKEWLKLHEIAIGEDSLRRHMKNHAEHSQPASVGPEPCGYCGSTRHRTGTEACAL